MRQLSRLLLAGILLSGVGTVFAKADTFSYTGFLSVPESASYAGVVVPANGTIIAQTYGFGGGVNSVGWTIAPGGFDPFVGIFNGFTASASLLAGTSDILTNYTPGCPPAATVTIGTVPGQCGDVRVELTGLPAGIYYVSVTDAGYFPAAVFESGGTLGDGYIDLTGGVFQTCVDASNCNIDTGNYGLDVTVLSGDVPPEVPEPPSAQLAALGIVFAAFWSYRQYKTNNRLLSGGSQ